MNCAVAKLGRNGLGPEAPAGSGGRLNPEAEGVEAVEEKEADGVSEAGSDGRGGKGGNELGKKGLARPKGTMVWLANGNACESFKDILLLLEVA